MSVTDLLLPTGEISKGSPDAGLCCPQALQAKGKGANGENHFLKLLPVPAFILAEAFF